MVKIEFNIHTKGAEKCIYPNTSTSEYCEGAFTFNRVAASSATIIIFFNFSWTFFISMFEGWYLCITKNKRQDCGLISHLHLACFLHAEPYICKHTLSVISRTIYFKSNYFQCPFLCLPPN